MSKDYAVYNEIPHIDLCLGARIVNFYSIVPINAERYYIPPFYNIAKNPVEWNVKWYDL